PRIETLLRVPKLRGQLKHLSKPVSTLLSKHIHDRCRDRWLPQRPNLLRQFPILDLFRARVSLGDELGRRKRVQRGGDLSKGRICHRSTNRAISPHARVYMYERSATK